MPDLSADRPTQEIEIIYTRNAGWCWRCWPCDYNVFNLTEEEARRQAREHVHGQVRGG
jgi:hypothetical protein